jgi:hypothetical protein
VTPRQVPSSVAAAPVVTLRDFAYDWTVGRAEIDGLNAWEIDQVLAAAYHEAGHTVFALRHGVTLREQGVWINAEGFGATHYHRVDPAEVEAAKRNASGEDWTLYCCQLQAEVEIAIAGWLAEFRYHGVDALADRFVRIAAEEAIGCVAVEQGNDISVAANVIAAYFRAERGTAEVRVDEVVGACNAVKSDLARALRRPRTWQAVETVALALVERHHLSPHQVEEIVTAIPLPRAKPKSIALAL